jgi:hypothetical protein
VKSGLLKSILAIVILLPLTSYAQTSLNGQVSTITTGVPFLRISPDARAGAMGDAGIAVSADANAHYWNIAKVPFNEKNNGLSITYTPWMRSLIPDISLIYLTAFHKFGADNNQAISGSLRYFNLGDINFTDINASPIGTGKPREMALDLGYSRKLSENLSAGVALRYVYSNISSGYAGNTDFNPGKAFATDLGIYYTKSKDNAAAQKQTFSWGVVISNLGSKISYSSIRKDFIPMNLGIGLAYTKEIDEYNKVTFALDFNKLLVPSLQIAKDTSGKAYYYYPDKGVISGMMGSFSDAPGGFKEELSEFTTSLGMEYWYQNKFTIRAGYFYEDPNKGARKYYTLGAGVKYNVMDLNFSYLISAGNTLIQNPLANTLRVSLLFNFDSFDKVFGDGSSAE